MSCGAHRNCLNESPRHVHCRQMSSNMFALSDKIYGGQQFFSYMYAGMFSWIEPALNSIKQRIKDLAQCR